MIKILRQTARYYGLVLLLKECRLAAGGKGWAESKMEKINVNISKTSNGKLDYLQIMSADMITINIVLIAKEIKVIDRRPKEG